MYWRHHMDKLSGKDSEELKESIRQRQAMADEHWTVIERNWQWWGSVVPWWKRYRAYWTTSSSTSIEYVLIETSSVQPVPRVAAWLTWEDCERLLEETKEEEEEKKDDDSDGDNDYDDDDDDEEERCERHWLYRPVHNVVGVSRGEVVDTTCQTFDPPSWRRYRDRRCAFRNTICAFKGQSDTVYCLHAVLVHFGDRIAASRRCVETHTCHMYSRTSADTKDHGNQVCRTDSVDKVQTVPDPRRYLCTRHVSALFCDYRGSDTFVVYHQWCRSGKKEIHFGSYSLSAGGGEDRVVPRYTVDDFCMTVIQGIKATYELGVVRGGPWRRPYQLDLFTYTPMISIGGNGEDSFLIGPCEDNNDRVYGVQRCCRAGIRNDGGGGGGGGDGDVCMRCTWEMRLTSPLYTASVPTPPPSFSTGTVLRRLGWEGWCGGYPTWWTSPCLLGLSYNITAIPSSATIETLIRHQRLPTSTDTTSKSITTTTTTTKRQRL